MGLVMVKRKQQGGFTLMEVLISLVLGAVAMIGVIALYRASSNASSFSRRSTEASVLAQDKLEKLRTEATVGAVVDPPPGTIDESGKPIAGGAFTRVANVILETINLPAKYYEIDVTVTWQEEGLPRQVVVRGRRNIP